MQAGMELATRVAAITRSQRISLSAVEAVHADGGSALGEYIAALERVYTDTARSLRDNKADVVRQMQRIDHGDDPDNGPEEHRSSLEAAMVTTETELDVIVGIKVALREVLRNARADERSPSTDVFIHQLLQALVEVRALGIISESVFDHAYAHLALPLEQP